MSVPELARSVEVLSGELFPLPQVVVPPDWFDRFWQAYPRKIGKPAARKAFATACRKSDLAVIGQGLRRWVLYWMERDEPQFIPHPTTWLNQERWNDDPPPLRPREEGLAALDRVRRKRRMEAAMRAL